jgi:hypothetical protein
MEKEGCGEFLLLKAAKIPFSLVYSFIGVIVCEIWHSLPVKPLILMSLANVLNWEEPSKGMLLSGKETDFLKATSDTDFQLDSLP